ncbi:MAG: hypothetical protein GX610_16785 [Rhodococcus sp.]|nr:hypothetical protein [Rhodococcus sp. (in: high G+C Gram-positive bacteria)]
MDIGTVTFTYDGRVALRFQQAFSHPPEKVWAVITEPQYLQQWFPAEVQLDVEPGSELIFHVTGEQVRRYGLAPDHTSTGTMITARRGHILEYLWDGETLHWEIAPDGQGGSWLTLTHTVEEEESAYAHAPGWHAGLEVVEAQLAGREIDWSPWDRAEELASSAYRRSA